VGVFLRGSDFCIDMMFGDLATLHGKKGCNKRWLESGFRHGHVSDMQDMPLNSATLPDVRYYRTA
jgi:hypothetical protein